MGKKIAVFPEPGAIGPVMNLVGICQGLKKMGHEPIFILEPGLKGTRIMASKNAMSPAWNR